MRVFIAPYHTDNACRASNLSGNTTNGSLGAKKVGQWLKDLPLDNEEPENKVIGLTHFLSEFLWLALR